MGTSLHHAHPAHQLTPQPTQSTTLSPRPRSRTRLVVSPVPASHDTRVLSPAVITNGQNNDLVIQLSNTGAENYTLVSAAASYHDPAKDWKLVKNVTASKFNVPLIAGGNLTAPFQVNSEFKPQELGLTVWVDVKHGNELSRVTAFNSTVSIVEPASSWFDPGAIFIYLVLGVALFGGAYLTFQSYFGDASSGKKKRSGAKRAAPAPAPVAANPDGKAYDEDWIPQQHTKKAGKKSYAGAASEGLTSGGEGATSGGEASGAEGKTRRRKGGKK
ncbi:hypothetical protein VHUM_03783 [Vanrija humicola]|uniref:Uncharacterized protein n=1 Tax=Vanrija humicola TaxID=5417 RepID=A0A7D8Z0Q3_VANHU|nr:hypothetical protein VHUM_03783 [Vanrija humicola]